MDSFFAPKNLIVVYKEKDELAFNQLKKMVDTNDDAADGTIFGTEDGSVKVVAWNEKTWLDNKRAGNLGTLDEHVLFIGDIKGVDQLIPTLDIKFNKYGVKYGFSGRQAAIMIDHKPVSKKSDYENFVEDLKRICDASTTEANARSTGKNAAKIVTSIVSTVLISPAGFGLLAYQMVRDAKIVRKQQILYGVAQLYRNHLDKFMKS